MVVEFATGRKSELYRHVSKLEIKGNTIYLYYTDNRTFQEYLDRVPINSLRFFNVMEDK